MVRKAAGDGKTTDAEEDRLRHTKSKRAGMWEHQTLNLFFPLGPLTCSLRSNATSLQDVKKKNKKKSLQPAFSLESSASLY